MCNKNEPFLKLLEIAKKLRGEGGCPWDQKQTLETVKNYLLEESYEVVEAIESKSYDEIKEELGDLLFQIIFITDIARSEGKFDINDVIEGISEKLIRRHPHIFGDIKVKDSDEVVQNWLKIKKNEEKNKEKKSVLDGIPKNLPALLKAQMVSQRASCVGFDWSNVFEIFTKVEEEIKELKEAIVNKNKEEIENELGDLLFAIVNIGRFLKINPEDSLKKTISRFILRFNYIEEKLGEKIKESSIEVMENLWQEAKNL